MHEWNLSLIAERRKSTFSEGWISVLDVPPFLRTRRLISSQANLCGGLSEEEEILGDEVSMEEISFRAKGNINDFIPLVGYL